MQWIGKEIPELVVQEYIWNENFTKNVGKHPEWLEPQEEADIFIIYKINPIEINVDITEADF